MKSILLILFIVLSFSAGLTAFLWDQLALAIVLAIILPVICLYILVSGRYQKEEKQPKERKRQAAVDNYFHPVDK